MSHLLLVDAHAVLHRAYHSIPLLTVNGQPVNAIYGFYSMLLSALDQLKPDYLVVALDSPGPTFRQTEFVGYRAKRKTPDRDLLSQLPLLPQTLQSAQISAFSMGGYEADDLIATLVRRSLKKILRSKTGHRKKIIDKVTIITGDKDLMQLVDDRVCLYVPVRGLSETRIYTPVEVKEKLGVLPGQVVDLKALMGDMSDNYPGVSGIGPKAAVDLLTHYHSLDNIFRHLDDIKPSLREKLKTDKDNAYLSQRLATLIDNIPINFSLKSAKLTEMLFSGLLQLFDSYHFKSLSSRLRQKFNHSHPSRPNNHQPVQNSLF